MNSYSYLSYQECQNHDKYLIKNGHSMANLIHTAGSLIASWISDHWPNNPLIGLIGKGNNGKDILSAFQKCTENTNYFCYLIDDTIKDSALFQKINKKTSILYSFSDIPANAIIIDGLFGTGLNKPISPKIESLIQSINNLSNHVISIDIPSGLSETTSSTCIKANTTLAMMFPKKVFLNPIKKVNCGNIFVLNFNLTDTDKNNYKFPNISDNYIRIP